jgi:CheY-like chemotaxis protein
MPDGGVIKIKIENINIKANPLSLKEGEYVQITIEDQGTGIPKEHLQKIFDPYFTTKEKGGGLGLAIAYSIIRKHDGHITAESIMEVGTTFHVYLPASREKAMEKPVLSKVKEKDMKKMPTIGHGKILLMDDEDMIRVSTSEHLKRLGYEAETAEDGSEAIKLYKRAMKSGKPFDAVVMDLTIPGGMGGEETIKKLLEIDPNVKGIVASGYFNESIMANFREYGFSGVIAKPYEIHELNGVLQEVINAYT